MTALTLESGSEGRLRLKEGAHSCTYSWVEVLIATALSPERTACLYQMRGDLMESVSLTLKALTEFLCLTVLVN